MVNLENVNDRDCTKEWFGELCNYWRGCSWHERSNANY